MNMVTRSVLSAVAAICVSPLVAVELPNPLAWFDLKDVSSGVVRDASGNGCDLTLGPTVAVVDDETVGRALEVTGQTSDWATFTCPVVTNTTIAFWMNRTAEDASILVDGTELNLYPYVLSSGYSGFAVNWWRNSDGASFIDQQNDPQTNFSGPTAAREEWHHVAFAVDYADDGAYGTLTCRAYLDGVLVATTEQANNRAMRVAGQARACLLNRSKGDVRPCSGRFADFRFYDVALTAAQVRGIVGTKLPRRLVLRYAFDALLEGGDANGRSQVAETTGQGAPLTLCANTTLVDDGVDGKALRFMGTDEVGAFTQTPNVLLQERTIAVWLRPSSRCPEMDAQSANPYPRLFEFPSLNGGMGQFGSYASQSRSFLFVPPGQGTTSRVSASAGVAELDTWSHLAIVERLDAEGLCRSELYVNGEPCAVGTDAYELVTSAGTQRLYLGNNSALGNRYYCGDMDDFRLYSYALSADEIRRLYRGLAQVEAGEDFTVAGTRGVLHGRVAANAGDGYRKGYAGEVAWSLVSAPEGRSAAILNPASAETAVSLSGEGTYVFRLSVSDLGVTRSDEVAVTCVAEDAANAAPSVAVTAGESALTLPDAATLTATVTDDGRPAPAKARVRWSKKAGPGGVWFESDDALVTRASFGAAGAYVLTCTADDGQSQASADVAVAVADRADGLNLNDGLLRYWSLDGQADPYFKEAVTGSAAFTKPNYTTRRHVKGKVGNGVRASAYSGEGAYFSAGSPVGEVGQAADANGTAYSANPPPLNDYLTISAWICIDPEDENLKAGTVCGASIVGQSHTFGLRYNEKFSANAAVNEGGFTLFQQGRGGSDASGSVSYSMVHWPAPEVTPVGRWMHVCAVLARNQADNALWEMWYDGVKQKAKSSTSQARGRVNANPVLIAGMAYTSKGDYNGNWPAGDGDTFLSRTFPGIVDEVRIWSRKLTAAEIRFLAANPIPGANRGPSVDAPTTANATPLSKRPTVVASAAFADRLPAGGSLVCEWAVVSGDATCAVFGDKTAHETTFTARKKGVYVLQLKVTDGERTVWSRPLTVEVKAPGVALLIR